MKQIKLEKETIKTLGNFCLDIGKLIFGGVILSGIIGLTDNVTVLLLLGMLGTLIATAFGILLINRVNKLNREEQ